MKKYHYLFYFYFYFSNMLILIKNIYLHLLFMKLSLFSISTTTTKNQFMHLLSHFLRIKIIYLEFLSHLILKLKILDFKIIILLKLLNFDESWSNEWIT